MACYLLYEKRSPKSFWVKAANVAVSLLNFLPTRALQSKSAYEPWYGSKPSVTHLKVFGCICFAKIHNEKRTKLDPKSQVTIHLCFNDTSKWYKLYNVDSRKVIVCKDVRIDEDLKWN